MAIDPKKLLVIAAHRERAPRLRGRHDARSRRKFGVEIADVGPNSSGRRVQQRRRQRQSERKDIVGPESRVDVPERDQTADHETRAHQQNQRHSHFQHHEDALCAMARAATSAATFLERFV